MIRAHKEKMLRCKIMEFSRLTKRPERNIMIITDGIKIIANG